MSSAQAGVTVASKGRRVMIFTAGTRGDVQPFVALGLAMQRAGFTVRLGSSSDHIQMLREFGLEVANTGMDYEKTMNAPEVREALAKGNTQKVFKLMGLEQKRTFPEHLASKIREIDEWKPDVILATPIEQFEVEAIAAARGIPLVLACLQVVLPSKDQVTMLGEPKWFPHRLLGTMFQWVIFKVHFGAKYEELLKQLPECKPFVPSSLRQSMLNAFHPIAPVIVGFSPSFYSLKEDWPADAKRRVSFTGFWVVGEDDQVARTGSSATAPLFGGEQFDDLSAFLATGPPPVYMGWGSMMSGSSSVMTCLAVRSLMKANLRGVVLSGWAKLGPTDLEGQRDTREMLDYVRENVFFATAAPHEWLFPQCAAIVHHGGSGTTAAGLRSGVPSVVTPFAFDQFDNANLVADSGAGIRMKHFAKVTVADMAGALKRCTTDGQMIAKARSVGGTLRAEDGLGSAVRTLDEFIVQEVDTGEWITNYQRRAEEMSLLRARGGPGCRAWMGRLCCSGSPNDYSVTLPRSQGQARSAPAPTLLVDPPPQQKEEALSI